MSYFGSTYFGGGFFGTVVGPITTATPQRYGSADLLAMCKEKAGRPAVDMQMTDDAWYRLLSEAQDMLLIEIASRVPSALNQQFARLETTDGGVTYTFGNDVYGEPLLPLGHVEIWARETGGRVLFASSYEDRGGDFVIEGTRIRSPAGLPRQYSDGPYARWTGVAPAITSTVQPIINPRPMRVLLVYYAVMLWAERGQRRDPIPWAQAFRREWLGDPTTGQMGWCAQLQLRFATAMVPARGRADISWWTVGAGAWQ